VTARSGVKYKVAPEVADKPFEGSFKNMTVIMVQDEVRKKAKVQYRPPDPGSTEISVLPK
jgi:hypothetical protein